MIIGNKPIFVMTVLVTRYYTMVYSPDFTSISTLVSHQLVHHPNFVPLCISNTNIPNLRSFGQQYVTMPVIHV